MKAEGLVVNSRVTLPWRELQFEYSRSSGPGGQHVNRTESRVTVRFRLVDSPSIPPAWRQRAIEQLQSRLTRQGELVLSSDRHRERLRNRDDVCDRLAGLLRGSFRVPTVRKETRPTRGSVRRRIEAKKRRSDVKRQRRRPARDD